MPIENIPLSAVDFDYLQQNITDQSESQSEAAVLAQSGLEFVVLLQKIPCEVDLVNPYADHLIGMENLDTDSNFSAIASALNNHVIARGTTVEVGDTLSSRLNRYLSDNAILVTQTYARISSGAGFIIDASNIDP